jgi:hypothetical protein
MVQVVLTLLLPYQQSFNTTFADSLTLLTALTVLIAPPDFSRLLDNYSLVISQTRVSSFLMYIQKILDNS